MSETAIELMERALAEVKRGKGEGGEISTPGMKEARMASEQGHDGGAGNKTSNRAQGDMGNAPDKPADVQENSKGNEHISGTGPAPSFGNRFSAKSGPAAARGALPDIRRQAALKELEKEKSSGGNAHSNTKPGPAAGEGRVGDVKAPAKAPADKNKKAEFEGTPPFAKEPLGGDGWGKAAEKARQMYATKK